MSSSLLHSAWSAMRGFLVSRGSLAGYSPVFKFGFNGAVGTTEETIWSHGGVYAHPSSASTMTVSSDDANDTAAGTGARTVSIYGLDADYIEISETISLNGQTAVTTTNNYLRMNRVIVRSAGTGETNAGVIYVGTGTVTAGVPANIFSTVSPGEGQTLQTFYTVPAGFKAYLYGLWCSSFGNANAVATIRLKVRPDGEVFQTKDKFLLTRAGAALPHFLPIEFDEKTDIEVRGTSSSGTIDVSATIEILLVRK